MQHTVADLWDTVDGKQVLSEKGRARHNYMVSVRRSTSSQQRIELEREYQHQYNITRRPELPMRAHGCRNRPAHVLGVNVSQQPGSIPAVTAALVQALQMRSRVCAEGALPCLG